MSVLWQNVVGAAVFAAGTCLLPAAGMHLLVPSLESAGRTSLNYRGRPVFLGLGIVWVFWAIGLYAAVMLTDWIDPLFFVHVQFGIVAQVLPLLLVFVFGLIDDTFGSSTEKGLGGHLSSLVRGRLTTGALKLIGIGLAALLASAGAMLSRSADTEWTTSAYVLGFVAAAVLIAGAANLLNLLDLRPGRALKSYLLLVGLAWLVALVSTFLHVEGYSSWAQLVVLALVCAGPVLAVWRYDIGERGMLGDAGANPAGALAGVALATVLPLWGIVGAAVAVVALNLASERVSFSQVIANNQVLSWLDMLGRLPEGDAESGASPSDVPPRNGGNDG